MLPIQSFIRQLPDTLVALIMMVLATAALSAMHGMVRYLSAELDTYTIAFFRNFFGLVAVTPLVLKNSVGSLKTSRLSLHILRGVIGIGAMLLWFRALATIPIATATALSFTAALFVTITAVLFLGERVRGRRIAAILTGFAGVLVVLRPASESFDATALMVLGSTLFWAIGVVLVKTLSTTERTASIVAWSGIMLSILSLPLLIWFGSWPTADQFVILLAIGGLGTLGHLCLTSALSLADSTAVMSLDFLRLLWTVLIGTYFFADTIDFWTVVGAFIIFASGLYIIFRESKQAREITPQA